MDDSQSLRGNFVSVQGLKTHYTTAGEGPALFVLPGWGSSSGSWAEFGEELSKEGLEVIIPDLPGFGESEPPKKAWGVKEYKDFAAEFAKKLGKERFFLAGHSFGGQVAILLAAEEPSLVQKLLLLAPAGVRHERGKKEKKYEFLAKLAKAALSLIPSESLRDGIKRIGYRMIGRYDYAVAKGVMREVLGKVIREDLSLLFKKISCPTHIIWGEEDDITPKEDAFFMKENIPSASLDMFPGVGHRLRSEAPEKLRESMRMFLKS